MRVTFLAIGSRGDVQPMIAFGLGLRAAGHTVTIATHSIFGAVVRERGLLFHPLKSDPRVLLSTASGRALLKRNRSVLMFGRRLIGLAAPCFQQDMFDCWQACRGADVIVGSQLGVGFGLHIADKLHAPLVRAYYVPVSPTSAYPAAFVPAILGMNGRVNTWTHAAMRQVVWAIMRSLTNAARRDVLKLPPLSWRDPYGMMDRYEWPVLYGHSPAVLPPPRDWPDWVTVTGFWFLDRAEDWRPPADLVRYLEAGPPPVYVGFGSMTTDSPSETSKLVLRALALTGNRAVLDTGWGGLSGEVGSPDVYLVNNVPHDWLFPRMSAVVHHGGVGTTHAGIRAGVPSVIVPFLPDQRFWGHHVWKLGVGTRPIPRAQVSVQRLDEAIRVATTDQNMRERAASIGRRIRTEDGVARAVEAFRAYTRDYCTSTLAAGS